MYKDLATLAYQAPPQVANRGSAPKEGPATRTEPVPCSHPLLDAKLWGPVCSLCKAESPKLVRRATGRIPRLPQLAVGEPISNPFV